MEESKIVTSEAAECSNADDCLVAEDLLIEEISIDSMCGVY